MDQKLFSDVKDIDQEMAKLHIEKNLLLEKQLQSNDVNDIFKAATYIEEQKKMKKGDVRSFLFDPYDSYYQYGGYKNQKKRVGFDVLKKIAETPIVGSAINTRIFQMQNFLRFVDDTNQEGFTVRKKKSLFEKQAKEPTTEEKKKIEFIVTFLESGGLKSKWDISDDLAAFTRKVMRDSLSYDQTAAECQRNRRGELVGFYAIDASTVRLLETIDPKFKEEAAKKYREQFGQFPRYGQVFQGNIVTNPLTKEEIVYYPWELMYEQRNKTSDIDKNGYGTSEIEILLDIITWSLWGMQYNGNFFKQGSNPKGFINLKDDGVNTDILNDFRQTWRQMIAGVNNSHKIPVFAGLDMQWIDLQSTNKDMEFQNWMDFLIIMICSVFTIDPSELGFQFQKQAQIFGQDGQKERLSHSKNKGLKPLLIFYAQMVTKYLVSEIDADYEFVFCGLDVEDEAARVDIDAKKLQNGMISMESAFEKNMGRKFDPKKDTILNSVYQQAQQMKMYGGQDSNEAVDDMTGENGGVPNPFQEPDAMLKSLDSNPFVNGAMDYFEKHTNLLQD